MNSNLESMSFLFWQKYTGEKDNPVLHMLYISFPKNLSKEEVSKLVVKKLGGETHELTHVSPEKVKLTNLADVFHPLDLLNKTSSSYHILTEVKSLLTSNLKSYFNSAWENKYNETKFF